MTHDPKQCCAIVCQADLITPKLNKVGEPIDLKPTVRSKKELRGRSRRYVTFYPHISVVPLSQLSYIGQWWCNTTIKRADVQELTHRLATKDLTHQIDLGSDVKLKWSAVLHLDIAGSNDRLRTIYNNLKGIEVLETPADV